MGEQRYFLRSVKEVDHLRCVEKLDQREQLYIFSCTLGKNWINKNSYVCIFFFLWCMEKNWITKGSHIFLRCVEKLIQGR